MTGPLSGIRHALRQRRHHRAFRIAPPMWDEAQQTRLEQVIADLVAVMEPVEPEREPERAPAPALDEKALADAATNLWRAQQQLTRVDGRLSKEIRQAGRYLRTGNDVLAKAGLVVQDHDGDAFHPGLSLEVLVYEDDPSSSTETVLETVRPSVYFGDHRIQMGQVIVSRPARREHIGEDTHA
ncbi:MAG: hypothetical protein M3R63_15295 [Actinomycetota bacterium]|nr:hypothetical protein [Actinomycetota bacterium]